MDFPSAGGVIAKSAFNQLFLTALERGDRYGELTYLLRVYISNIQDIHDMDGPYASGYAAAELSRQLVLMRRQSDIIGQTDKGEYCLMLLHPQSEQEPKEAAKRFADTLDRAHLDNVPGAVQPKLSVELVSLPLGRQEILYELELGSKDQ